MKYSLLLLSIVLGCTSPTETKIENNPEYSFTHKSHMENVSLGNVMSYSLSSIMIDDKEYKIFILVEH
jgi:hypothetical protein